MTSKIYRTAQGKQLDIGALQLKNENVRAVGNMNVNARGDVVDSKNRPIDSRNNQVAKQYRKQASNVVDSHVPTSTAKKPAQQPTAPKQDIPTPPEDFDDFFAKPADTKSTIADSQTSGQGIAAAISRARQNQQT